VFTAPARIPAGLAGYKVECEFTFRLKEPVPGRAKPFARADIDPLLVMHPGVELAGSRYAPNPNRKPTTHEGIADNGTGGAFVLGEGIMDWRQIPFATLPIEARIDGGAPIEVYQGAYRRDAAGVVVETINDLGRRGIGLNAGDCIATGSLTMPTPIQRGQRLAARFGDLGEVTLRID
jgi:2-keto-4-pentenoate hydratase